MVDAAFCEMLRAQDAVKRAFVDAYKVHQDAAAFLPKLPEMFRRLIQEHAAARAVYLAAWDRLTGPSPEEEQQTGQMLVSMLDALEFDFAQVRELAATAKTRANGADVVLLDQLEKADQSVCQMREELASEWPWMDQEQMAEAKAAYERGEWEEAGDILRGIGSPRSQTH